LCVLHGPNSRVQVTKTIWGVFPLKQNRVCISLDNQITYNDANANSQVGGQGQDATTRAWLWSFWLP